MLLKPVSFLKKTAAGGGATTPVIVTTNSTNTGSNTSTVTHSSQSLGATDANRQLYVVAAWFDSDGNSSATTTMTVDGNATTRVHAADVGTVMSIAIFAVDTDPGGTTGNVVLTASTGGFNNGRTGIAIMRGVKSGGWTEASVGSDSGTSNQTVALGGSVSNGDIIIAAATTNHGSANTPTWSAGVTMDASTPYDWDTSEMLYVGVHESTATETRTITGDAGLSPTRHCGCSIKLT